MKTISVLSILSGLLFAFSAGAAVTGVDLASGSKIELPDSGNLPTVYVFLSARCPCSRGHEARLAALHQEFSKSGFRFIGIHSNQNESSEETRSHFVAARLPFPVIEDPDARLADEFRALKTPHVFVKKGGESLFEGGVDDTASGTGSEKQFLRDALMQIRDGKPVTEARVRVLGCAISRSKS
jgi:hypothetical protein